MSNLTADVALLTRLKAGEKTAVREWYHAYSKKMLRWVVKKVRTEADAEELVQDIFMSCLKHLPLFRGESAIWTWMARIAQHEVADYYRRYYAKKTLKCLPLVEQWLEHVEYRADLKQELKDALSVLSHEYQELLLMKYVDRRRVKDIAAELGRTVKAVESDLFRARQALSVALEG
jgi:RNA polymerase sigma factor (sigma-70 family)